MLWIGVGAFSATLGAFGSGTRCGDASARGTTRSGGGAGGSGAVSASRSGWGG